MSTKPTLVLVPGSFCEVKYYDNVVSAFRSKGYDIVPLELRTVTKKPGPPPTMYDDAAHIRGEVAKLADEGKDIVLIAHSYGGIPTSESLKSITKKEREAEGKKGGVVRVAYMTALVPELGMNSQTLMGDGAASYIQMDEEGWLHQNEPATTASYVFTDLSPERGLEEAKKLTQHSAASFANELTHAGYKDVPASYLFCDADKCVTPEMQQKGIDHIEKASGKKVDVTHIPTDHVPNVSAPEKVVDWWVHIVEKGAQEN